MYFWGREYKYNVTLTRAYNSCIVYILYDDELYMLKSNKVYAMLGYVSSKHTTQAENFG